MKYNKRLSLTPQQGAEIYPLLDKALQLPFNKAIVYPCSDTRADYLTRIIMGERYRNAVESIEIYTPEEPLYGKGLYYHVFPQPHSRGLILANVENPPATLTWMIIQCAAFKEDVTANGYAFGTVNSRLGKLRERYPDIINPVYLEGTEPPVLKYGIPKPEEIIIVDIDVSSSRQVPEPTTEQYAKARLLKKQRPDR